MQLDILLFADETCNGNFLIQILSHHNFSVQETTLQALCSVL